MDHSRMIKQAVTPMFALDNSCKQRGFLTGRGYQPSRGYLISDVLEGMRQIQNCDPKLGPPLMTSSSTEQSSIASRMHVVVLNSRDT